MLRYNAIKRNWKGEKQELASLPEWSIFVIQLHYYYGSIQRTADKGNQRPYFRDRKSYQTQK
jgi:hypothetical protein